MSDHSETTRLVCAATWMELRTYDAGISEAVEQIGFGRQGDTLYLVTGVGVPLALLRVLQVAAREQPRHILNLGIAGAYPNSGLGIGDIIAGTSEVYGDLGFELPDPPGFQPLSDVSFGQEYATPYPLAADPRFADAPKGRGCTVNACTGTRQTGLLRERLFDAAFETMEGAAVAQAGQALGIPVCEVRSISNIAARRDMQPSNIRTTLDQLTRFFEKNRENFHA